MTTKNKSRKPAEPKARVVKSTKASRKSFQKVDPEQILGRAMLINVCVSMWEGRKHDREVTQKVNDEFHAAHDAGRYHKHLFGGKVKELSAIITAAANIRLVHYTQTLPWSDAGFRLLPTQNYMAYMEAMRKARARFEAAVEEFVTAYPKLVRTAREKLNGMFRDSDYPAADLVRHRYRIEIQHSPLPAGGDFRLTLPKPELERMAREVEERLVKSVEMAMQDAWQRLGDAIMKLRAKLDDGKYLRESMIDQLREVADVLGRLNLTGDESLESARKQVLTQLATFDAEALRDDEKVREKAAQAADAILKSMEDVYTPSVDEDEEEE